MLNNMITIGNDGPLLASTNYFEHELARQGQFYLSWNASALRILVPDNQVSQISEMRTGRECIISRGKYNGVDCLELMFDDDSDQPYVLFIGMDCVDREVKEQNLPITVTAWTSQGAEAKWVGRYRKVKRLPCLDPWPRRKSK